MGLSDNRDRLGFAGAGAEAIIRALRPKLQSGDFSWIPLIERDPATADLALTSSTADVTGCAITYTPKVRQRIAVIGELDLEAAPSSRLFTRCRRFDGTDDFVSFGDVADQTSSFSIELWLKPTAVSGTQRLVSKDDGATLGHWTLYLSGSSVVFLIRSGSGALTTGTLAAGTWVHVAAVYDTVANTKVVYINGVSSGSNAENTNPVASATNMVIGRDSTAASNYLGGALSEVRIWSRALTQREVRANMYRRISGVEPNLSFYWQCDDPVSTTADPIVGPEATPTGTSIVETGAPSATGLITVTPTPLASYGGNLTARLPSGRCRQVWCNVFDLERDVASTIKLQASADATGVTVYSAGTAITLVGVNRPTL